jgi:hypothetical protein
MLSENMLSAGFGRNSGWHADIPDAHFNCAVLRTAPIVFFDSPPVFHMQIIFVMHHPGR